MNPSSVDKVLAMWKLARSDSKFFEISTRYDELEEAFAQLVSRMSQEEQNIMWGFVTASDELDFHVMELMCEMFDINPIEYLKKSEANQLVGGDCHVIACVDSQ